MVFTELEMKGVDWMKIRLITDNPLNEIDSLVDIQMKQSEKLRDSRMISMISLGFMIYVCISGYFSLLPDIEIKSYFELMEAFSLIAIISMSFSIYYQHCLNKTLNKISALKDHYIFYSAYYMLLDLYDEDRICYSDICDIAYRDEHLFNLNDKFFSLYYNQEKDDKWNDIRMMNIDCFCKIKKSNWHVDELDFNDINKKCFKDYKIENVFSLANISYFDICKLVVFDVLDFDDLINVLSKFLKSKLEMIEDKEQINKSRDLNSYGRTIGKEILSKYNIDS